MGTEITMIDIVSIKALADQVGQWEHEEERGEGEGLGLALAGYTIAQCSIKTVVPENADPFDYSVVLGGMYVLFPCFTPPTPSSGQYKPPSCPAQHAAVRARGAYGCFCGFVAFHPLFGGEQAFTQFRQGAHGGGRTVSQIPTCRCDMRDASLQALREVVMSFLHNNPPHVGRTYPWKSLTWPCQSQVVALSQYRLQLSDYLRSRMQAIAPNLTIMVGELVGARLIAHAGSLINLAKQPASTVQILGAEKALFRALKTKVLVW